MSKSGCFPCAEGLFEDFFVVGHIVLKKVPEQVPTCIRIGIFELCRYQSELPLPDYFFVAFDSSRIAFAGILNTLFDIGSSQGPNKLYTVLIDAISSSIEPDNLNGLKGYHKKAK